MKSPWRWLISTPPATTAACEMTLHWQLARARIPGWVPHVGECINVEGASFNRSAKSPIITITHGTRGKGPSSSHRELEITLSRNLSVLVLDLFRPVHECWGKLLQDWSHPHRLWNGQTRRILCFILSLKRHGIWARPYKRRVPMFRKFYVILFFFAYFDGLKANKEMTGASTIDTLCEHYCGELYLGHFLKVNLLLVHEY